MNELRTARLGLGLKQGELAREAGISKCALSEIERGKYRSCPNYLKKRIIEAMVRLASENHQLEVKLNELMAGLTGSA